MYYRQNPQDFRVSQAHFADDAPPRPQTRPHEAAGRIFSTAEVHCHLGSQADQRLRQRCSTWRTFDCLVYTEPCYLIVIIIRMLVNVLVNYCPSTKWPLVISKCIVVQTVAVN